MKFLVVLVITFVIVFLMNYIGNTQPDKLQSALLNGLGGMVGLTIGMMIYNRSKMTNQARNISIKLSPKNFFAVS